MTRVVHVRWVDAASVGGWRSRKAMQEFIETDLGAVDTVGIVVHEDDQKIVLIQTYGANEVMGLFEIPKGCIKSVRAIDVLPITLDER